MNQFFWVHGILILNDELYVSDSCNSRMQIFRREDAVPNAKQTEKEKKQTEKENLEFEIATETNEDETGNTVASKNNLNTNKTEEVEAPGKKE